MGKERDAFRVLLLSVMGELGPPLPTSHPTVGRSPMLECFRRRQIRASLSSFW